MVCIHLVPILIGEFLFGLFLESDVAGLEFGVLDILLVGLLKGEAVAGLLYPPLPNCNDLCKVGLAVLGLQTTGHSRG